MNGKRLTYRRTDAALDAAPIGASLFLQVANRPRVGVKRSTYCASGNPCSRMLCRTDENLPIHSLPYLKNPLICQIGPKTSAKSGWSCSIWEKRCINGPSQSSRMVGSRS